MKIVLFALNGSYTHTSLALRCLRPGLEKAGYSVKLIEGNLRDRTSLLLHELYSEYADIYGFSCYIWNITEMLSIATDLKSLLPNTKIVLGGPEVSYGTERFTTLPFVDAVVRGEGENILPDVCSELICGNAKKVYDGVKADVMHDEGILYRNSDFDNAPENPMLYYESSRGCPYACTYCLSSAETGIRAKTVEQTLSDLTEFEKLPCDCKIIKFVDRTFNFDPVRAGKIWSAIASDTYTKKYHFEICASLLTEENFEVLREMPKGKIQLEVGLQSTNPETLGEVSRHLDVKRTLDACRKILNFGNIHLHLDLIAGLPYEDILSFKRSFDEAYGCCHKLQLGFLKLLYGTKMRERSEEYGMRYMKSPPYTVLETKWITYNEMHLLERISFLLERFYESGNFDLCLAYAMKREKSPFDFYSELDNFISETDGREIQKISQPDAYKLLFSFVSGRMPKGEAEHFSFLMHEDFSRRETRKPPKMKL